MYKGLGEALGWEMVIGISVAKKKKKRLFHQDPQELAV